eukprot:PhF_6_TR42762/c0_g1_i1/m.64672
MFSNLCLVALLASVVNVFGDLPPIYNYTFDPKVSSWEFQLESSVNLTNFDQFDQMSLQYYGQFAANKTNYFTFKPVFDMATYNIDYWIITTPGANDTEHTLMKSRHWHTGSRANTTDLTIKFKHTTLEQWVPLPNQIPTAKDKLENDVHCLYNGVSYSVLNPNIPKNFTAKTLADLLPLFSPDLATYLNMSLDSPVKYYKKGIGKEGDLVVSYNHKKKTFIQVKGSSTMQYESTVDANNVTVTNQELSIRVKRGPYADLDLISALNTNIALFQFLAYTPLNTASCVPKPPPMANPKRERKYWGH